VLHYLLSTDPSLSPKPQIAGLLLESPLVGLHPDTQPNTITVMAGRMVARLMPHRQMKQDLDAAYMSRSEKVRRDWVDDPLCHDTGTLEGLAAMLDRSGSLIALSNGQQVTGLTNQLPCPIWLAHGDGDKVNAFEDSKRLCDALVVEGGDKEFKNYPGGYHKLHCEPEGIGEQFTRDAGEWMLKRARKETNDVDEARPKL